MDNDAKWLKKFCKEAKLWKWKEFKYAGINMQQTIKIKRGEIPNFRAATIERLRKLCNKCKYGGYYGR